MSKRRDDLTRSSPGARDPGRAAPPRLARALLLLVLPRGLRDDVLGDLQEGFVSRVDGGDRSDARRWYWRQVLQSVRFAGGNGSADRRPGRPGSKLAEAVMGFLHGDVRYALRQLRSQPGFTTVAVVSLALGIGINAIIFSLVNGLLLKPLPVRDIDEVYEVFTSSGAEDPHGLSSYPDYVDFRDEIDAAVGLAAEMTMLYTWNRDTHSESLFGALVSANYFDVLGTEPARGRWFLPEEDTTPGTHQVVVLGHGFWQRNFAPEAPVIGETLSLSGADFTIVGVAPAAFTGTIPILQPDLWTPLMTEPLINMFDTESDMIEQRGTRSLRIYGRLAEGATPERLRAQLDTVADRLAAAYPATNANRSITIEPLAEIRLHPAIDAAVTPWAGFLMGLVGLVLLVACANVANMLLARATARRHEIGMRLALGASRWRVVRQLLTESVILSLAGGAAAFVLTWMVARLLMSYHPPLPIFVAFDVSPDGRVLSFTLAASLVTSIAFGLVPALRSSKLDLVATLRDDAGGGRSGFFSLRNGLVVAQVAVSLVLLVAAGLFARSLANAQSVELGFDKNNIAFVSTSLSAAGYELEEGRRFLRRATDRIDELPGVTAATFTARLPMNLTNATEGIFIEGYEPADGDRSVTVDYNTVGPGYFDILGVPIIAGRDIAPGDDAGSPLVAVVNRAFVDRYVDGSNALGRRVKFDADREPWIEIVGVAENYKMSSLGGEVTPLLHTSLLQQTAFFETIMVRTEGDAGPMVDRLRRELSALDPGLSFFDARTMDENLTVMLLPMRAGATVIALFGLIALGLAAVGVYGVIAYTVACRMHEIGVRIALGAESGDVLRMVVGQGMTVVMLGVTLGLLGAAALAQGLALAGALYDVPTFDPIAFTGTAAVLLAAALLANYIPARRGARVDPMVALRSD